MDKKQIQLRGKEVLARLGNRYYGLLLPAEKGMSSSPAYKQAVLAGKKPLQGPVGFVGSEEDAIVSLSTPVGEVEAVYLEQRADFELFLQKIGQRCEPEAIPPEVGAMMISGVINWEKINAHKEAYLAQGNLDWKEEFKRFTAVSENFKDRVLVLSGGPYSNVPPEETRFEATAWNLFSVDIRMYHECTHYICRTRWPGKKDPVIDEVVADAIGLLGAFGRYDKTLAGRFLGFAEDGTYQGGRLSVYVPEEELSEAIKLAREWMEKLALFCEKEKGQEPFAILEKLMEQV